MKIGLIDVNGHHFPNLALMKLSAWHKAQGDTMEWHWGFGTYDCVYMSKVFDKMYSHDIPEPCNAHENIKSGRKRKVYVLTNYGSTHEQDLYRVYTFRNMGYGPYVMIYDLLNAPRITHRLQRWVNNKRIFHTVSNFSDYIPWSVFENFNIIVNIHK